MLSVITITLTYQISGESTGVMPENFNPARQPELDEEVAASIIIQAAYREHLVRMARRKESVEVCVVQLTLNRNVFEC